MEMNHEPWAHQKEDWEASRDLPAAAIPWPPRLGKTKVTIDTAAWLASQGRIDAVVVIAPNGVHLNWSREEIPTHWPLGDASVVEWIGSKAGTVRFQRSMDAAIKDHDRFLWFVANIEAVATSRLGKALEKIVRDRRCLLVIDEAHEIANPTAKRTKALFKLVWPQLQGRKNKVPLDQVQPTVPYRRTLTGTPVRNSPFDLWSQYYVLDPRVLGTVFTAFKSRVAVIKRNKAITCKACGAVDHYEQIWNRQGRMTKCKDCGSTQPVFGPLYDVIEEYRNLDKLNERIAPITFPRRKEDCLDLPDRIFTRRYFVMPEEHERVYLQIRDELIAQLSDDERVTAAQALTNLLRLQQVSRGNVTLDDGTARELGAPYPAVDAVHELVVENPGKTVVWCRFVSDVALVVGRLMDAGIGAIRCDGTVPASERPALLEQFRNDPAARVWVGTLATGGVGVDLSAANLMIFYSHGFDLVQRLQGLERNFGSRQKADRVEVVDLVAADTVDVKALAALERKENLAAQLTGAKLKELLT